MQKSRTLVKIAESIELRHGYVTVPWRGFARPNAAPALEMNTTRERAPLVAMVAGERARFASQGYAGSFITSQHVTVPLIPSDPRCCHVARWNGLDGAQANHCHGDGPHGRSCARVPERVTRSNCLTIPAWIARGRSPRHSIARNCARQTSVEQRDRLRS